MAATNRYVVLFWHHGLMPTAAQTEEARQYGPHVMFRNANFHQVGSGMEPCIAIAGEVPADYAAKYPRAVPYIEWFAGALGTIQPQPSPPRSSAKAPKPAVDGNLPMDGMTGVESSANLPPPPPPPPSAPPVAGRSMTGNVFLPPPPPE